MESTQSKPPERSSGRVAAIESEFNDFIQSCAGLSGCTLVGTKDFKLSLTPVANIEFALERVLRALLSPVCRLVPVNKVIKWLKFSELIVWGPGHCPCIALESLRDVHARANLYFRMLKAVESAIQRWQAQLRDSDWLNQAWTQADPHLLPAHLEKIFGDIDAEHFKVKQLDLFAAKFQQPSYLLTLERIFNPSRERLLLSSPSDETELSLLRLVALIRGMGAEVILKQSGKRCRSFNEERRSLPTRASSHMRQTLVSHFLPVAQPEDLGLCLCLLAAYSASKSAAALHHFVKTCEAQALSAYSEHRLVPPHWMIGLMRFHMLLDTVALDTVDECYFDDLLANLLDAKHLGQPLIVRVEDGPVWMVMTVPAVAPQNAEGLDEKLPESTEPACTLLWFDPDQGSCEWVHSDATTRSMKSLYYNQAVCYGAVIPRHAMCRLQRLRVTPEQCNAWALDHLTDSSML